MGTSKYAGIFTYLCVLVFLKMVDGQGIPGFTGGPRQTCFMKGSCTLVLGSNKQDCSMKLPDCPPDTQQWFWKVTFDQFPFDCRQNESFFQVFKPVVGFEPEKLCKVGTGDPQNSTIVDDNNEAIIDAFSDIYVTISYMPNGHQAPGGLKRIKLDYTFLQCPDGLSGNTCKTTTSLPSTTPVPSTPSTTKTSTLSTTQSSTTASTTSTSSTTLPTSTTRVYDGTFCVGKQDPYPESHIVWSNTDIGDIDIKPCPLLAEGNATRRCIANITDPLKQAVWELPDLSNCISPFFKETLAAANSLSNLENVGPELIIDITSGITNATGNGTDNVLYAGDLSAAGETVGILADVLKKSNPGRLELHRITKGCSDVLSNIVDPSTADVWKFTRNGYLENKVTTILHSVERLSTNVASQFSAVMTTRRKRSAEENIRSENTSIAVQNLELSIHVLDRAENFSSFADEQMNAGIALPDDVFKNAIQGTSDPYIHLYFAKFTSIASLVTSTNSKINGPRQLLEPYINSDVLSSKILNADESLFKHLKTSVRLSISTKNTSVGILAPHCVFLNMSAISNEDRWSRAGCIRSEAESNETNTVCYCNHLTNFAVLMDIYDVETSIDEFDGKILTYLSYGGGALSILGCFISIIVFEIFRLKSQRIRIHEQLAVTIILVQLFFMVGIDRTENKYVCKVLAICLHYVLVAMFCWMLVEGAHLYLVLVKVFKSRSHMKKYVLIGWGVPVVIVGISAGIFHADYGTGPVCWITHKVLLVAFVPAVSLVIVINTVVLIVVMRIMFNSMSKGSKTAIEERSSVKSGLKAACILLPLLGLTWIFGYLSVSSKETLVFTYLFTFFNSMQGVFFFVFHCLLSADVQNAYERRSRRKSQIRLTESSFSKRTRKGSDFESYDYSGGSRESVRTGITTANSTLNRRVSHDTDGNGASRTHSVSFDDTVFTAQQEAVDDRLHRSSNNSSTKQLNTANETPYRHLSGNGSGSYDINSRHNSHVMNNIIRGLRHNSESTDGYVLYYGSSTPVPKNDIQSYSVFDKNDLYASVKK